MNFGVDPLPEESTVYIDLTSMIDVLFVLLLFFMVTTTFSASSSLDVNLPTASAKTTQIAKMDLVVSLTENGAISIIEDGGTPKPVEAAALKSELEKLKKNGAELSLVLRADKHVDHGTVVTVLDNAKQAGIDRIAIATVTQVGN